MIEFINENLKEKLEKIVSESIEIKIISAFLKNSGLDIFKSINHNKLTVICGIDFFITEPDALTYLQNKNYCIKIFHEPKKTFHPKCIYIKTVNSEYLVVGSSNITSGGFSTNYEVSILMSNDYQNMKVFESFARHFKNLLESKYCFDLDHPIYGKYCEKYSKKEKNIKENFDNEIEMEFYNENKPINNVNEINRDDWVYHDTFGLGNVKRVNINYMDVFFIEYGLKTLMISNQLNKIFSFESKLVEKYFIINNSNSLDNIINEYKIYGKKSLEERDLFYKEWKPRLLGQMSSNDIYEFFEESSKIWTLMMLKKNIISKNANEFNDYMDILKNNDLSILEKFEIACNKADTGKIFDGLSHGITSSILSILYPLECIVYNNASNDFLRYFNIQMQKANSKKILDKYSQYSLFGRIMKEKFSLRDLVEVDCFIGYVKVNYLKNS